MPVVHSMLPARFLAPAGTQVTTEVVDPGAGKARGDIWGIYACQPPATH